MDTVRTGFWLKGYALFKNSHIVETGLFGFYFFSRGNSHYIIKKLFAQNRQIRSFHHGSAVKVNPVGLLIRKSRITGNFNGRNRGGKGGSSAGAELLPGGPAVVAPSDPQAPGAGGGSTGGGGLLSGPGLRRAAPALAVPLPVLPHPGGAGILHPPVCPGPAGGGGSYLFASLIVRAAVKTAAGREPGGRFYHLSADSWLISSSRRDSP